MTWLGRVQHQAGVVSRQQALDAGFSEKAIEWRLRRGTWQRLHAAAYATFSGIPSREGRLWAAVLHVGPGAVLSHETAAEIHRLTDKQSARIHVSVPIERWPDVTEYRCRTASEIAEVLRSQGWTGTLRRCGPGCTAVEPQERGDK